MAAALACRKGAKRLWLAIPAQAGSSNVVMPDVAPDQKRFRGRLRRDPEANDSLVVEA